MTQHLHLTPEAFESLVQTAPLAPITADDPAVENPRQYVVLAGVTYSTELRAVTTDA